MRLEKIRIREHNHRKRYVLLFLLRDKRRRKMEYIAEMKLLGDGYPAGFSCGMTMCRSQTMERFKKISEDEGSILYKDDNNVELKVIKEKKGQCTSVRSILTNSSDKDITVEMIASFAIKDVRADKIHRLQSFWSAEGKLRTETIDELHMEPSWNRCAMRVEKFGNVGSMPVRKYFPFVALEDSKSGQFVAVQIYCASSWQIELLCKESEEITVVGGLADRDLGHWMKKLAPQECFETPMAVVAEGKSLYEVCDKLVKAQSPVISPVDNAMGIMFNEYCTTWGNPSFENVKRICDRIAGKGIQYLVIDSGWYGDREYWWDSIGDWDVNQKKFPGGMKPIADYIRKAGMIPGMWFEMESLASGSKYYNSDHLVMKDGQPLTVGGRRFWDMEDPWVIDYLTEKVIGTLKEGGYGYLKVDYNDTFGMGCDGAESLGEGLRRKVIASQRFFEKIREEIPGIVIENCSSGGHRLEPSMMELVSQASFSDAHETQAIPLIAANMHRVIKPEQSQIWAVLRADDSIDRIYYSLCATLFGRMCLSGDIYDLSEEQWKAVDEGIEFYKKVSHIIKDGVTTKCEYSTIQYNAPTGEQLFVRELSGEKLVIYHRFENSHAMDTSVLEGCEIIAEYGKADKDLSAQAWLLKKV